jgi:hypothetical protein
MSSFSNFFKNLFQRVKPVAIVTAPAPDQSHVIVPTPVGPIMVVQHVDTVAALQVPVPTAAHLAEPPPARAAFIVPPGAPQPSANQEGHPPSDWYATANVVAWQPGYFVDPDPNQVAKDEAARAAKAAANATANPYEAPGLYAVIDAKGNTPALRAAAENAAYKAVGQDPGTGGGKYAELLKNTVGIDPSFEWAMDMIISGGLDGSAAWGHVFAEASKNGTPLKFSQVTLVAAAGVVASLR